MTAILFILILFITMVTRIIYHNKNPQIVAKERISRNDKLFCMFLAGPFPPAVLILLEVLLGRYNDIPSLFYELPLIIVEAFAFISAFRLIRLALSPVWIVGLLAFPFHFLVLGWMVLHASHR